MVGIKEKSQGVISLGKRDVRYCYISLGEPAAGGGYGDGASDVLTIEFKMEGSLATNTSGNSEAEVIGSGLLDSNIILQPFSAINPTDGAAFACYILNIDIIGSAGTAAVSCCGVMIAYAFTSLSVVLNFNGARDWKG
jgi:hypothetical protein